MGSNQEKIIEDIFDIFDMISEKAVKEEWGDTKWTSEIKSNLCEIGHKNNFAIAATNCKNSDHPEWLYDMTWILKENNIIYNIGLIMECEWSVSCDEIFFDFDKLLVGKSDFKMMIFQQRDKNRVLEVMGFLKKRIINFKKSNKGDIYLFSGYDFKTTGFEKSVFVYQ